MILFFNTLKTMGFENIFTAKKFEKCMINCLNLMLNNGTVEVAIDEKIVSELPKLDESLTFENILIMQIEKVNELKELLIMNIGSLIVTKMMEDCSLLDLDESLSKEILALFFKYAFEQENGK